MRRRAVYAAGDPLEAAGCLWGAQVAPQGGVGDMHQSGVQKRWLQRPLLRPVRAGSVPSALHSTWPLSPAQSASLTPRPAQRLSLCVLVPKQSPPPRGTSVCSEREAMSPALSGSQWQAWTSPSELRRARWGHVVCVGEIWDPVATGKVWWAGEEERDGKGRHGVFRALVPSSWYVQ